MTAVPRVTVGLPVFNGERYLAAAIRSLLEQDHPDFELIVADNASTDGSLAIARDAEERDPRVRVVTSARNRGAAWNYNRVVDLAVGPYFKWAAHDDLLEPSFLRRCVDVLDNDAGVVLAYTRAVDIDEEGRVVHQHDLPAYAGTGPPSERARRILLDPSPCMESFGVVRRAALRRTAGIGAYTSSDRTLFLELALQGRFHEVPEVLFLHRQHEGRSVHRYADARARNVWFDPSWAGRRSSPRWRLLSEYAAAVSRSQLAVGEKLRTAGLLPRWAVRNRRALGREAASALLGRGRIPVTRHRLTGVEVSS